MPELVIQLTRAGFLALLWLFVLAALRVVRSDLYSASGMRVPMPGASRVPGKSRGKSKAKTPHQMVVTHGALAGTRISLDGRPILIGRADDYTLVLDDDYASTRHAQLVLVTSSSFSVIGNRSGGCPSWRSRPKRGSRLCLWRNAPCS